MTLPRTEAYLRHMLAARAVTGFVEGLDRASFMADRRTQQAVVMNLLNRMIHGYFETDFGLVWETVRAEIPALIAQLAPLVDGRPT